MIVDGAVVMVENVFRHKQKDKDNKLGIFELITAAASEVERPIVYAIAIIILSYSCLFSLCSELKDVCSRRWPGPWPLRSWVPSF